MMVQATLSFLSSSLTFFIFYSWNTSSSSSLLFFTAIYLVFTAFVSILSISPLIFLYSKLQLNRTPWRSSTLELLACYFFYLKLLLLSCFKVDKFELDPIFFWKYFCSLGLGETCLLAKRADGLASRLLLVLAQGIEFCLELLKPTRLLEFS